MAATITLAFLLVLMLSSRKVRSGILLPCWCPKPGGESEAVGRHVCAHGHTYQFSPSLTRAGDLIPGWVLARRAPKTLGR